MINEQVVIPRKMVGRTMIKTSAKYINHENVIPELTKALNTHNQNKNDITYLEKYYRGDQPILNRLKKVRPDINNKVVENRANEIVSFKTGYLCGEPIQYVSRTGVEEDVKAVNILNNYMYYIDKSAQDQELVEWANICGTSFRIVLPGNDNECPIEMYTLDPRNTFVVYSNEIGNKPLMGVKYAEDIETGTVRYSIYTEREYFEVEGDILKHMERHALKMIPIFEYPANNSRLGSFEIALPLLDALNTIASNRVDGIEQVVQAFFKFVNCDIDDEKYASFLEKGAIAVSGTNGSNADVDLICKELNQTQTQITKEDIYNAILTICGVPSRQNGSTGADTGKAVELRDGWSLVEARAKDSETIFKKSEKRMLRLVLSLCKDLKNLDLKLSEIDMKFTRRNYENIQTKAQVLDMMLNNEKIHPLDAYLSCGMFSDAESSYKRGMENFEKNGGREITLNKSQTGDNLIKTETTEGTV